MMHKSSTPSYILTLPLRYEPWQKDRLDKLFSIAGTICNNLIADRKKALQQVERTRQWKKLLSSIQEVKNKLKPLNKIPLEKRDDTTKASINSLVEQRTKLYQQKRSILERAGFSEFEFQNRIIQYREYHGKNLNAAITQKLATQVWQKFRAHLYGKGEKIDFIPWTQMTSLEGKSNASGFIFRGNYVEINKMKVRVALPKPEKEAISPSAAYEFAALRDRTKYCRIIRRWHKNKWQYMIQLIQEGEPPVKVRPQTGELFHQPAAGRVGLDIGPQTLAAVGEDKVCLTVLADKVQDIHNELRRVNRAMDRSRRATNPGMFAEDGTIIPRNKLPAELCVKGKRKWKMSRRYKALAGKRRELFRKQSELRIQCHHELANQLISYGNEFYIEKMDFRALAKRAKKTEKSEKTGKYKRKKRFGKSIANKAPATFVNIMADTAEKYGGVLYKINTRKAKASQYNHETKAYKKKQLSKRWNDMPDGTKVQRDLYSAFLIMHTNDTLDGFIQEDLEKDYLKFVTLHNAEIARLRGSLLPSSMGIR